MKGRAREREREKASIPRSGASETEGDANAEGASRDEEGWKASVHAQEFHTWARESAREVRLERETSCRFSVVRDFVRDAWRGGNCARARLARATLSPLQIGDRSHAAYIGYIRLHARFRLWVLAMIEPGDRTRDRKARYNDDRTEDRITNRPREAARRLIVENSTRDWHA